MQKQHKKWVLPKCYRHLLFLLFFSTTLYAQNNGNITVIIQDTKGEALSGASVNVANASKGFSQTSSSNNEGLTVFKDLLTDSSYCITVSYIGMELQKQCGYQVKAGQKVTVIIKMKESLSTQMNEVVVVGYGTRKKSDVTGAIGSVAEKDFNRGVVTSPESLFQGKIAGVNVTGNTGEPGGNQTVVIRGPGSLRSGNGPLMVVDGVPLDNSTVSTSTPNVGFGASASLNPLNFINPADIESIDVLKDASATAIYGSRAANGVIIITTKKGSAKNGGLTYSNYFGTSSIAKKLDLFTAAEFIAFQEKQGRSQYIFDRNIATDWQDQIFRQAFTQNHNLALNGGTDKSSYYMSLSAMDQEGIIKTNELKRYTARFKIDQLLLKDRLKVTTNITYAHINNTASPRSDKPGANSGSLLPDAFGANPTYPVRNADGILFVFPQGRNPLADLELFDSFSRTDRVLGNIEGKLKLFKGLEYRINYAIDRSIGNGDTQIKRSSLPNMEFPEGRAIFLKNESTSHLIEHYLNYVLTLKKHNIEFLAGQSYQYFFQRAASSSINNFSTDAIDAIYNPGIGTSLTINQNMPTGTANINELQSYFGRVNYSFNDKYLLTATIRKDGSSKFGKNNRYGIFPSVSGAWKLNQEDFISKLNIFSELKLRAGWGQTGNQEIPNKITLPLLSSGIGLTQGYPLSDAAVNTGYIYNRTANPNLKWETTTQTNVGLDFGLFQGALTGTADYFNKNTSDMLLQLTVADPISPTTTKWGNVPMNVINKGLELSLNYASSKAHKLNFSVGGNATFLKNTVKNAPFSFLSTGALSGPGTNNVNVSVIKNGEPLSSFFLQEHIGFDANGNNVFRDINRDKVSNANDRIIAASPIPTFLYGLNATVSYDRFDLALNFNGVSGNKVYNNTANAYFNFPQLASGQNIVNNGVNDQESRSNSATPSTRYLEDGSFLRLNNATLRYNLNLNKIDWLKTLSVYVTGQNLFTITNYSGMDPEVNVPSEVGGIISYGIDTTNYPRARTFLLGLNLSF
ncbi:SusC/RagA family TonB-linked outer membrane protein [Pedobacter hiemivivus]|uniref:SusC/RagA family TonB-linked outer membrane protein n=1 Tax=Pedobacter hiemivivus TaxID=2530454 RepID=A0A4R0NHA4_9SPHI|nr:SusC/RagA family TonB-linked outer membrane protein [Pedobacter hiemivivus]TCC99137.1 SusC/RagA family TonB-linked outer membrane protein [Pedobacter hiemivivus]